MARKIKKYNPGFLTDQELVDSFCVRAGEFALLVEALRESTGNSNPHAIVIGPRGSGKTTLLLRVAAKCTGPASVLVSESLPKRAESPVAASSGQCLFNRAAGSQRRARPESDIRGTARRPVSDMALAAILDFAATQGKRLLLPWRTWSATVGDPEVGWELRKTLQCEPRRGSAGRN